MRYCKLMLVLSTAWLIGCMHLLSAENSIREVRINAGKESNRNTPVALDLVFIYDDTLQQSMPKSAHQWFIEKDMLSLKWNKKVDVLSSEVVPLSLVSQVQLPKGHHKANKVIAYANYLVKEGQAPIDITHFKHACITLKNKQFAVAEC